MPNTNIWGKPVAGNRAPVEGRGALFTNHNKKHAKAPDLQGEIMLNGKMVKLSAWKYETAKGVLLSLAVDTYQPGQNRNQQQYPREVETKDGGDVPW